MSYRQGDESIHNRGSDGRKPDLGFIEGSEVCSVILSEKYKGVWKVDKLHGLSYKSDVYQVWNPVTRKVAWRGYDKIFAEHLCERINGWWEARDFPPPQATHGPAFAPDINPDK